MTSRLTFAIYREGTLSLTEQPTGTGFIVAGHLDGNFSFDQLISASSAPLLYATPESTFSFEGVQNCLENGQAGIAGLIDRLGYSFALELMLTEATIDATRARQVDLINNLLSRVEFE